MRSRGRLRHNIMVLACVAKTMAGGLEAMGWWEAARPARQAAPDESGVKPPHFKKTNSA